MSIFDYLTIMGATTLVTFAFVWATQFEKSRVKVKVASKNIK